MRGGSGISGGKGEEGMEEVIVLLYDICIEFWLDALSEKEERNTCVRRCSLSAVTFLLFSLQDMYTRIGLTYETGAQVAWK